MKADWVALETTIFLKEERDKMLVDFFWLENQLNHGEYGAEGDHEQGVELSTVQKKGGWNSRAVRCDLWGKKMV